MRVALIANRDSGGGLETGPLVVGRRDGLEQPVERREVAAGGRGERLLDEVSFDAPNRAGQTVRLDAAAVDAKLSDLAKNEDLSRYIL